MAQKTLLLADDDEFLVDAFARKFTKAGYNVITAVDGQAAFDLAVKKLPDVIVSDYRMPNMGGLQFAGRVRQSPLIMSTPMLFLTSEDFTPEVQEQFKKLGVQDYLQKSLDVDVIIDRVKKLCPL